MWNTFTLIAHVQNNFQNNHNDSHTVTNEPMDHHVSFVYFCIIPTFLDFIFLWKNYKILKFNKYFSKLSVDPIQSKFKKLYLVHSTFSIVLQRFRTCNISLNWKNCNLFLMDAILCFRLVVLQWLWPLPLML